MLMKNIQQTDMLSWDHNFHFDLTLPSVSPNKLKVNFICVII